MHHILAYMPFGVINYTMYVCEKKYTSGQIIAHMLTCISTCLTFHSNNNVLYGSFRFTVHLAVYCLIYQP